MCLILWGGGKLGRNKLYVEFRLFSHRQKLVVFKANNCHLHLCHKNDMMQDYNCFYQDNLNIIKVKNLLTFLKKKSQMQNECIYLLKFK